MAVEQLASPDDVAAILGRSLNHEELTRVAPILDKASELFRLEADQTWTATTTTVRLKANGGDVVLPETVDAITSVVDDDGNDVAYTQRGQVLETALRSHEFATVTYETAGEVPDLVRLAIAEIAQTVLLFDEAARNGVTSATDVQGPFTQQRSYAAWAVGGATRLSPEDKALARSFRTVTPTVHVMRSC